MPYAHHEKAPAWVFEHSTSRLLISESGHGFLLDCGYQRVIDAVQDLIQKGIIKKVDGLFVTHHHDDHTDKVQAASEAFQCPVYATPEYADVLEHPEAYHIPAMTANAVKEVVVMEDGATMPWHEFSLTFRYFPGQTYYHGALLAAKNGDQPIFFVGDSFAPSGIDDYCVLNRNLVHEDTGYLRCLETLRSIQGDFWLVNEHIPFVFSFTPDELDYLETRYRARIAVLQQLFPWDDPNFGLDEHWACFYPYGAKLKNGASGRLEIRVTNHSPTQRTFAITPRAHGGLALAEEARSLTLQPREVGSVEIEVRASGPAGNYIVTADVSSSGLEFREWTEALITIE
jgi:glyoxylase-like metal-dependent hydrolase (beta-lactamase superfamily II)